MVPLSHALSNILALIHPRSALSAQLLTGGDWAMLFPAYQGVKFTAIVGGACWLRVEGDNDAHRLHPGDCYLLTDGRPYRLGSDLALDAADAREVFAQGGNSVCHGAARTLCAIGGRFDFDPSHADLLIAQLPPVVLIPAQSHHAAPIQWLLDQLARELDGGEAGSALMSGHLAHMLLLHALRQHLGAQQGQNLGWLGTLGDPKVGAAMALMHGEPAGDWTLAKLATQVGMSRTVFTQRFKALVGRSPMDYLLHWRMRLAAHALGAGSDPVASIAYTLGYQSDSAFNHAFKRVMRCTPKQYRLQAQDGPPDAHQARVEK